MNPCQGGEDRPPRHGSPDLQVSKHVEPVPSPPGASSQSVHSFLSDVVVPVPVVFGAPQWGPETTAAKPVSIRGRPRRRVGAATAQAPAPNLAHDQQQVAADGCPVPSKHRRRGANGLPAGATFVVEQPLAGSGPMVPQVPRDWQGGMRQHSSSYGQSLSGQQDGSPQEKQQGQQRQGSQPEHLKPATRCRNRGQAEGASHARKPGKGPHVLLASPPTSASLSIPCCNHCGPMTCACVGGGRSGCRCQRPAPCSGLARGCNRPAGCEAASTPLARPHPKRESWPPCMGRCGY